MRRNAGCDDATRRGLRHCEDYDDVATLKAAMMATSASDDGGEYCDDGDSEGWR